MYVSLGRPNQAVIDYLKYEKDPTLEDSFLMSLANWGTSEERPEDLPEPSLSDNYVDSKYILNDGFMDGDTYISVDTEQKIKDNLGSLSTVNFPWMIWGYDLDIPEYVKYRNGNDFVYVRSVQDVESVWNTAGSLVEDFTGKEIFICRWNKVLFKKEYSSTGKTVASVDGTFEYGNNCTYSVPQKITDSNGKEYTFCGHTATLHSKNLVTSTSNNGGLMRYTCRFNNSTTYSSYGNNQYFRSMIRQYINSRVGYSEFKPSGECGEMYANGLPAGANGLLTKFYKDVPFMKKIMNQVNRVWDHQTKENPDICIDEIGLIPVSHTGYNHSYMPRAYDTSIKSLYGYSQTDALRKKFRMNIDGSSYSSAYGWWLRSAYSSNAYIVGYVNSYGYVISGYAGDYNGCSPLIVLG